jgi:hypothetical protein
MPIRINAVLEPAWPMNAHDLKEQCGLHTIRLSQFPRLSESAATQLRSGFDRLAI